MTTAPIEPDPKAWRALEAQTRRAIRDAARTGQPAPTEREAIATVAWSRWWRARYPYQMIVFFGTATVAACAGLAERAHPGIERLALTALASVLALAAFRLMVKRRRLATMASVNYSTAVVRMPDQLPEAVTLTPPRMWFVTKALLDISFLFWVGCSVYVLYAPNGFLHRHHTLGAVFGVFVVMAAITWERDAYAAPQTATIGPAGISVPWWKANIAWSAVRLVEVRYDRSEWRIIWYVERGSIRTTSRRKRTTARCAALTKLEIVHEAPDLALWLTQRYTSEAKLKSHAYDQLALALRRRQSSGAIAVSRAVSK